MTKKELNELIRMDKRTYKCKNWISDCYNYMVCHYIKFFKKIVIVSRKYIYYRDKKGLINKILMVWYQRKFHLLARKSHVNIQGKFGSNLKIWHENIIVNRYAELGDNVQFHGNNCVGNNGKDLKKCPKIGNNVDIGYGVTIIGDVEIADDIVIGANSLVNKSFTEKGIVIAGVPARKIK